MLTIDYFALAICLTLTLIMDFYFAMLIHLRYCGQFGRWFFFPMMVVFSLPSFFAIGIPAYAIQASSASPLKKGLLFFIIGAVYFVLGLRLAKVFLKKRFPVPDKKTQENLANPSTSEQ